MEFSTGPGPPCSCATCEGMPKHEFHCFPCNCCYFKLMENKNVEPVVSSDGLDVFDEMYGKIIWVCQDCRMKNDAQRHEKPPDWFKNCFDVIMSKISDLDLKLSTDVHMLASVTNAFMISQAPASHDRDY